LSWHSDTMGVPRKSENQKTEENELSGGATGETGYNDISGLSLKKGV